MTETRYPEKLTVLPKATLTLERAGVVVKQSFSPCPGTPRLAARMQLNRNERPRIRDRND